MGPSAKAAGDDDRGLDPNVWLGLGLLGILVFLLGVFEPAWGCSHNRCTSLQQAIQVLVAVGGGALAVLGFSWWWDARSAERAHPRRRPLKGRAKELSIAPSLEVYNPAAPGEHREPLGGSTEESESEESDGA